MANVHSGATVAILFALLTISSTTSVDKASICNTDGCFQAATYVAQSMRPGADPCDDFYDYACGRYGVSSSTANTKADDAAQTMDEFQARIDESVEEMLKQRIPPSSSVLGGGTLLESEKNAIRFYKSCIRYGKEGQQSHRTSVKFIKTVADVLGGFKFNNRDLMPREWRLEPLLTKVLHFTAHSAGFFQFIVDRDLWDYTRNVITLMPPTTFLFGDRLYFQQLKQRDSSRYAAALDQVRRRYRGFLRRLALSLNPNSEIDDETIKATVDFEIELSKITPSSNNSALAYELGPNGLWGISLEQMNKIAPGINWKWLFAIVGQNFNTRALSNSESNSITLVLTDATYFRSLSSLVDRTLSQSGGNVAIQNYLILASLAPYLCSLAPSISDPFVALANAIDVEDQYKSVCQGSRLDQFICLENTKNQFGPVVSRNFVRLHLTSTAKEAIEQIGETLRSVFIQWHSGARESWLDEATRQHAIRKAKSMIFSVGYPDIAGDNKKLERRYANGQPMKSDGYLENSVALAFYLNRHLFQLLDQAPSRTDEWPGLLPIDQNAQYHLTKHTIQYPAASCVEPYFSEDYPAAIRWGGVAAPMAHEFTHAFDATGRHYDWHGQVANWWSSSAKVEFKRRSQCLVDQYETFSSDTLVEGKTLDEHIADVTGLKLAYEAFRQAMGPAKLKAIEAPLLSLTNEQLFFVSSAMTHCEVPSQTNGQTAESGVHAPGKHRIWGMMMNLKEFATAFKCPAGSRMNPVTKCHVW